MGATSQEAVRGAVPLPPWLAGHVPELTPRRSPVASVAPARAATASRGGGDTYVFEGCVIGADVEKWVEAKVATGAAKVMDRGYARNRMTEAR